MVLQKNQGLLFAGLVFAIAAGMVMGLTTGLLKGPQEAEAQAAPTPGPGDLVFQLCKVWESNGVPSGSMTFNFDVSDISQTVQVPLVSVTEGTGAVCQLLSASTGLIVITEDTPAGFDEPEWMSDNTQRTADNEMAFFLSVNGCTPAFLVTGTVTERLVIPVADGAVRCTITFFNEDNDVATPTATPTSSATRTPTPTIVVCVNCNRTTTPPPATSTPTTPATATAPSTQPPSTQPPATATSTPTTSVGTQAPGLTDAQRTQTAVAAARTAAAQSTPIAPRTGGGAMGGAGGTLNIALLAAGLIVLSSGLSLVAVRGKRR